MLNVKRRIGDLLETHNVKHTHTSLVQWKQSSYRDTLNSAYIFKNFVNKNIYILYFVFGKQETALVGSQNFIWLQTCH